MRKEKDLETLLRQVEEDDRDKERRAKEVEGSVLGAKRGESSYIRQSSVKSRRSIAWGMASLECLCYRVSNMAGCTWIQAWQLPFSCVALGKRFSGFILQILSL